MYITLVYKLLCRFGTWSPCVLSLSLSTQLWFPSSSPCRRHVWWTVKFFFFWQKVKTVPTKLRQNKKKFRMKGYNILCVVLGIWNIQFWPLSRCRCPLLRLRTGFSGDLFPFYVILVATEKGRKSSILRHRGIEKESPFRVRPTFPVRGSFISNWTVDTCVDFCVDYRRRFSFLS